MKSRLKFTVTPEGMQSVTPGLMKNVSDVSGAVTEYQ